MAEHSSRAVSPCRTAPSAPTTLVRYRSGQSAQPESHSTRSCGSHVRRPTSSLMVDTAGAHDARKCLTYAACEIRGERARELRGPPGERSRGTRGARTRDRRDREAVELAILGAVLADKRGGDVHLRAPLPVVIAPVDSADQLEHITHAHRLGQVTIHLDRRAAPWCRPSKEADVPAQVVHERRHRAAWPWRAGREGAGREGAWRGAVGRRHGGQVGGEGRRGGR